MDLNKLFGVKSKNGSQTKSASNKSGKSGKSGNKSSVARTSQQTLPYNAIFKNGVIFTGSNQYAKIYQITDINFRTAGPEEQEALFKRICDMLNMLSSAELQFSCLNRSVSEDDFTDDHLLKMRGDGMDEYRTEQNDILLSHIRAGNNISSSKFLTVVVKSENIDQASSAIDRLKPTIDEAFRLIGNSSVSELSAADVITLLYQIYHPYDTVMPHVSIEDMLSQGIKSKDIIAPPVIEVAKEHLMFDDIYSATVYLAVYPNTMSTEFIAELNDLPCHLLTSVHLEPIPQDKAAKLVSAKVTNITSNVQAEQKKAFKRGYSGDLISPDMQRAREDALALLDDIKSKNQRLFYATISVQVFAKNKEELSEQIKMVQTIGNKHLCSFHRLSWQQEPGLATCMPIGLNKLEVRRLLTTEMAALLVPFSAQVLNQKGGLYYGLNAVSNTMILFDRLQSVHNANGVILGTSGSGKSFAAKREMINVLLGTDAEMFVVDPDGEYAPLAKMMGGHVIKFSVGVPNYLNPLDMDVRYGDEDKAADPVSLKADYMCSLCETIAGGRYGLSPVQKSVIDRCVRLVYQPYMEYMRQHPELTCDRTRMPTLIDFYELLLAQEEPESQNLALTLELYCTGSLNTFAHQTNVDTNSRFTVYDIKDIGSGLHELGLQVCLNDIWNRMIANKSRGKNTWFYLDEFYLLAQHESSAKFLQQIYKRARKFGGVPTGITQDVEDLLKNSECRAILNNCDFVMMLNQSPIGRAELASMYNISTALQQHITDAKYGHGLLYTGNSLIPFDDQYPKNTKSYKAMTTKMGEVKEDA